MGKRFLYRVLLAVVAFISFSASAQERSYKVSNPCIETSGSFTQPTYSWLAPPCYEGFPWYTIVDSLGSTAIMGRDERYTDTFRQHVNGSYNQVTFNFLLADIANDGTPVYIYIYGSADSGKGKDWVFITRLNDVSPTRDPRLFTVPNSWMYTNYMCVLLDVDRMATLYSWKAGIMIR